MLLTLVLFALGVGLISLLMILQKQTQDQFDKNLAGIDLVVGAKGSKLQLILGSMYHVDNPTGNITIKEARPFMNPKHPLIEMAVPLSLGDSHKGYRIVGTEKNILELYNAEIGEGKLWNDVMEVTLGAAVAADLNTKIGDRFKSSHGLIEDDNLIHEDSKDFVVTGILQPTGSVVDQLILTRSESIWEVHDGHAHDEESGHEHAHEEDAHDHGAHERHDHDTHKEHDHSGHEHHEHGEDGHDHSAHEKKDESKSKTLLDYPDQSITSLLIRFKGRGFQTLNMGRQIDENTDMIAASPAIEINRLYANMGVGINGLTYLAYLITFVSARLALSCFGLLLRTNIESCRHAYFGGLYERELSLHFFRNDFSHEGIFPDWRCAFARNCGSFHSCGAGESDGYFGNIRTRLILNSSASSNSIRLWKI